MADVEAGSAGAEPNFDSMTLDQLDAMARGEPSSPPAAEPSPAPAPEPSPAPAAAAAEPHPAAEAPATPAAAAPQADADDDDEAPSDPAATIPYQKYQRERKKSRERIAALQRQYDELNEKFARGDERSRMLAELVTASQPPAGEAPVAEDPEPDPNTDLIAWANWSRREMGRLREATTQTSDTIRETAAQQQMREDYQRDAVAFAREAPDFGAAYNHLLQTRAAQLQVQGYSEQEIRTQLFKEERGLVERARATNQRPAALIYAMAKHFGYAPAAPAPAAPAAPVSPAPAAPAAPPAAAAKPNVVEEIERIQRGQEASRTLSGTGGAAPEMTIEALAGMSDREFEALYAKKKGDIDSLLGKRMH